MPQCMDEEGFVPFAPHSGGAGKHGGVSTLWQGGGPESPLTSHVLEATGETFPRGGTHDSPGHKQARQLVIGVSPTLRQM